MKNQCYWIRTYILLVREFNAEQFLQRSAIWKFAIFELFWNTHVEHATLIFMHFFSKYKNVNIVCLEVCELFLYIKKVWHRYSIESCCISIFILRGLPNSNLLKSQIWNILEYIVQIDICVQTIEYLSIFLDNKNIFPHNISHFF